MIPFFNQPLFLGTVLRCILITVVALALMMPSHAQPFISDAEPSSLFEISLTAGIPYREEDFTSQWQTQRWSSRFMGVDGTWSPVWEVRQTNQQFTAHASLVSFEAAQEKFIGRLGVRSPAGWTAIAEQGGGTLGLYASARRFALVGQRESPITQSLRLWNLSDETDGTRQSITRAEQAMHIDTAWDGLGLQMRYEDDENLRVGLRVLGFKWTAEQFRLDQPRQIFPTDGLIVALSYASLQQQATEVTYDGWPLPYPLHEFGAGLARWEWESVTRFAQDGYTARVRFNGHLDARWGWVETRTRWFDSHLRLLWLTTETLGTVSSNSFPSLSEDLNPLEFTDALFGSIRFSRRWPLGEQAQWGIWVEQWIPLATWGTGNTIVRFAGAWRM